MRTVLITGANHGLGLALTRGFLAEGDRVIAVCRTIPDLGAHPNLGVELCELTNPEALSTLVMRLQGVAIDIVINNAGVYDSNTADDVYATKNFAALTKTFQVNSIVPRLLSDALVPSVRAGQSKLIISMTAGMGTYSQLDEFHAKHWAYSASKAALNYAMISFTKLYPDIKSTLVHPGWMQTRIGGADAPLPPEDSAEAIIELITKHAHKLPNGKMVDYAGKVIEL